MKQKGYSQADLVNRSALSKTTVSRICRNSNDKGTSYQPTPQIVMAICIGLRLTNEEGWKLFFKAFPELGLMSEILIEKMDIHQANILLYEQGLSLLGSINE